MSDEAFRLSLMRRALSRSDEELFGNRHRYFEVARKLAARLIAGSPD
ncbi:hypothetical protein [Caballeronia sp. dw_19]|jgi:hypothetical protein|nr:hypothetical protein [Caballeronia sp. dw_19]